MNLFGPDVKEYVLIWDVKEKEVYAGLHKEQGIRNQDGLFIGLVIRPTFSFKELWSVFDANNNLQLKAIQKLKEHVTQIIDSQQNVIGLLNAKGNFNKTVMLLNENEEELLVAKTNTYPTTIINDPTGKTIAKITVHGETFRNSGWFSHDTTRCRLDMKILDDSFDKKALLGYLFWLYRFFVPTRYQKVTGERK